MSAATESQGNVEKALRQEHRGLTKPREKSAAATARTTRNHFRTRTKAQKPASPASCQIKKSKFMRICIINS